MKRAVVRDPIMLWWMKNKSKISSIISVIIIIIFLIFFREKERNIKRVKIDFIPMKEIQSTGETKGTKRFGKHEEECRRILESYFPGFRFISIRPDWLLYNKGKNLEIDMFNSELNLCVEYNGAAHYKFIPFFHDTEQDFIEQQERDLFKKTVCERLGYNFITIPYTIKFKDLSQYIIKELKIRGY